MPIAIIGAGNVGTALGQALAGQGESIHYGVKDPSRDEYILLAQRIPGCTVSEVKEAIADAGIVILALPYNAALAVASLLPDWGGRVLIDPTNPLAAGLGGLTLGTDTSGAEQIAARAVNARVVKAFNTTGAENMGNPAYPDGPVFMPVCGDDAAARAKVLALARSIGFDAIEVGPLSAARYLEPMAMLWIHMAIRQGMGRRFAFRMMRR
jgi:predicted dinucleotide-binding enzyme